MIEVAAGVLTDAHGRVLLMQRLPGKHLAGLWEFPGGKLEPGETIAEALVRELREELGVNVRTCAPLISIPWRYPEKSVRLHALRVTAWRGEPAAREGHPLRWTPLRHMDASVMPPADAPILAALRLPAYYVTTRTPRLSPSPLRGEGRGEGVPRLSPSPLRGEGRGEEVPRLSSSPLRGEGRSEEVPRLSPSPLRGEGRGEGGRVAGALWQLRMPDTPRDVVRQAATAWLHDDPSLRGRLLLNHDIDLARELGVGVHLKSAQLRGLPARPLRPGAWMGASCHDAEELELAARLGADFATLSPLRQTASHPDATPLGWDRFAQLVAEARLPVYALGGVGPDDLDRARAAGAQGVAGIRAFASDL